jgi:hypothetical protein
MYTPCRKNKTQEFLNRINNKKRVGNIHSPNNSLTPWNRVLPATLIVTQLVKKYPPPPQLWNPKFLNVLKRAYQFRGPAHHFITRCFFTLRFCWTLAQPPRWRITPSRLSLDKTLERTCEIGTGLGLTTERGGGGKRGRCIRSS